MGGGYISFFFSKRQKKQTFVQNNVEHTMFLKALTTLSKITSNFFKKCREARLSGRMEILVSSLVLSPLLKAPSPLPQQ